jgi:hypothetical protein
MIMTGFFIKKAFFDGWDHLWGLVVLNIGALALLALFVVLPLSVGAPGASIWVITGLLLLFAYAVVCATALKDVAEYRDLTFTAFRAALRTQGPAGLLYGALLAALAGLLFVAAPFYLSRGTILGWFAFGTLFWCALIVLVAFQWFPAVRSLLPGSLKTSVRKCFMLMADNLGFSLFLALYTLVGLMISVFTAFLIPGAAGIMLGSVDALKLLIKKYDWLEANPGANRKRVPWNTLLEEERELVGKRTLKGMIFPWKE